MTRPRIVAPLPVVLSVLTVWLAVATSVLLSPSPAIAQTGPSYPQAGSPAGIEVGALTTPHSEGLAAVELGFLNLSSGQSAVTAVRICAGASGCFMDAAPDGAIRRQYLVPVPAPNTRSDVTVQLCNAAGCGGFFSLGTIVRTQTATAPYYVWVTGYIERSSANAFVYTPNSLPFSARYSDGESWSATCLAGFSCGPGGYAMTANARSVTIEAGGAQQTVTIGARNVHAFIEQPAPSDAPAPPVIIPPVLL